MFWPLLLPPVFIQIENLQDQLKDKEKQLGGLKDRVKSLQTDTSNTDTALGTLEEALAEKVHTLLHTFDAFQPQVNLSEQGYINKVSMSEVTEHLSNSLMIINGNEPVITFAVSLLSLSSCVHEETSVSLLMWLGLMGM